MKQVEKNERARFNWRGGLLYTLFIEIEVLVTAFVLTFAVYPVRFIFDEGFIRDFLEAIILVFIELLFRFIIFFVQWAGFPVRLFNDSEITVITLRRKRGR